MMRVSVTVLATAIVGFGLAADGHQAQGAAVTTVVTKVASTQVPVIATSSAESQTPLIQQYCVTCHNDRSKTGGLTLATFDATHAHERAQVAEKVIQKLRAGMMPPLGVRQPDAAAVTALVAELESRIDQAAAGRPNPGSRPFQRLNRAEYARAVRDLLAVDADVKALLPPDLISSRGFDNIAGQQAFSATLMDGYLRAAGEISRLAVGNRHATPGATTYAVPITASQMRHVEGAPIGTRGGISVVHLFPADGEYGLKMGLYGGPVGDLFGAAVRGEQLEVSLNGERMALLDINPRMHESDPGGLSVQAPPIRVKAGPQRVSAAFITRADGPVNDLIAPIEYSLADPNIGEDLGITALPHLKDITISGPHDVMGVSETPSRRKIFTCHPTADDEAACASEIIGRLANQAYRGSVSTEDMADLMRLYRQGRDTGDFESGIRLAIQAMLANPRFLFRLESAPAALRAGQNYRISDLDLASRLAFFLWATIPDAELVQAAADRRLGDPAVLESQVRRMLADPRSEALATRFAAQWLHLRDLEGIRPDQMLYPHWDHTLVESSQRETELFFDSLVREDRSVLDLVAADYTFANERLARHYRIPNVTGNAFRRVSLPDEDRRGILGHASILMLTSIADRTSPVIRGKWVMEVLLGTPPPPPPPNVPELEEVKDAKGSRLLSVRERMEEHRANPACNSCHRVIDPLGLALENFDATGAWRVKDNGVWIDASGELYDGTMVDGPSSLRKALLKRSDLVLLNFTESLMTYAVGRPVEYYDMPAVRAIVREAAADDNRMSAFILAIVKSAAFQMSRAEDPTTEAGVGASGPDPQTGSRR